MWYVINVDTGREDYTLELINRILDTTLGRAFLPKVVYRKKIKGEWQTAVCREQGGKTYGHTRKAIKQERTTAPHETQQTAPNCEQTKKI